MGRLPPALCVFALALLAGSGCRQKMAEQPYHRPLEGSDVFEDARASRPLERGVVHRGQYLDSDPMVTGLTREEWAGYYKHAREVQDAPPPKVGQTPDQMQEANRKVAFGAPRAETGVYVTEFPFEMKPEDLRRGQERYTIYCAVCHGPLGNGQGKIWERGYLQPTSFHTEPTPNNLPIGEKEVVREQPRDVPLGYSRGFALWGIKVPMTEVPVGYYFEVVTKGYAGMPSYSAQIPPADRWRIIAYIRVLQLSQRAPADLVQKAGVKVEAGGKQ